MFLVLLLSNEDRHIKSCFLANQRIKGGCDFVILFLFFLSVVYVFMGSIFVTGNTSANMRDSASFFEVATVVLFVVIVLLMSLDAIYSFHSSN